MGTSDAVQRVETDKCHMDTCDAAQHPEPVKYHMDTPDTAQHLEPNDITVHGLNGHTISRREPLRAREP
eukprot:10544023-Alexandrium_andersonii.AAC.1